MMKQEEDKYLRPVNQSSSLMRGVPKDSSSSDDDHDDQSLADVLLGAWTFWDIVFDAKLLSKLMI